MNERRVLAIVTARKGSKRLPNKNIKELAGKPLIKHTIDAALKCAVVTKVLVSTDCGVIASIAKDAGALVPFMRPSELSTDTATSMDVLIHAINNIGEEFDSIILLQPTSPLRNEVHITEAIEMHFNNDEKSVVSVTQSTKSPFWMYWCTNSGMTPILNDTKDNLIRRNENSTAYCLNGAIYISKCSDLLKKKTFVDSSTLPYIMSNQASIDIDTSLDFTVAELLISKQ